MFGTKMKEITFAMPKRKPIPPIQTTLVPYLAPGDDLYIEGALSGKSEAARAEKVKT
jgi:hypothetical protein